MAKFQLECGNKTRTVVLFKGNQRVTLVESERERESQTAEEERTQQQQRERVYNGT